MSTLCARDSENDQTPRLSTDYSPASSRRYCFVLVGVLTLSLFSPSFWHPRKDPLLLPEPSQAWRVAVQSCNQQRSTPLALTPDDSTAAAGLWVSSSQQVLCISVELPESIARRSAGITVTQQQHEATGCTHPLTIDQQCTLHGLVHIAVCDKCNAQVCIGNVTRYPLRIMRLDKDQGSIPVDKQMLRNVGLSNAEKTFLSNVQQLTRAHSINFRFLISGPSYGLVHSLPMAAVLPSSEFVYTSKTDGFSSLAVALLGITNRSCNSSFEFVHQTQQEVSQATIEWLQASATNIALMGTQAHTAREWHSTQPSQLKGRFAQVHITAHGHDEDHFNVARDYPCQNVDISDFPNPFKSPELQFTRTVDRCAIRLAQIECPVCCSE